MNRRVVREHLDAWIDKNGPNGEAKLAVRSEVSTSMIQKVRLGYVPSKSSTRAKLCGAIGVHEDIIFPLKNKKTRAS